MRGFRLIIISCGAVSSLQDMAYFPAMHLRYAYPMLTLRALSDERFLAAGGLAARPLV